MSFFGFDAKLPPERKGKALENDEERALNDKISRALAASAQEDVEVYTWGQERSDGLADRLEEANDDFNEDTFGAFSEDVGRDFDFGHGASADTAPPKADNNASAFAASLDDFWSTPALPVRSAGPTFAHQAPGPPQPPQPPQPPPVPQPKTLEEVEAELRAATRPAVPSAVPAPDVLQHPGAPMPQHTAPPYASPRAAAPPRPGMPARALTMEEMEAQLLASRGSPTAVDAAGSLAQPPGMPVPGRPPTGLRPGAMPPRPLPPGMIRVPPQPSAPPHVQATRTPPPNPQAEHLARMRALLEACAPEVRDTILTLPPPIQFESLEDVAKRFPAVIVAPPAHGAPRGDAAPEDVDAAVHSLRREAPARMQRWETAETKRRVKAEKVERIARYSGVMSGSDKDFITRIQISHMVSADPYTDDFYAHVYFALRGGARRVSLPESASVDAIQLRKSGDENSARPAVGRRRFTRHEQAMLRMQQQVERLVDNRKKREASKGTHTTLEGSLGRVSLGSTSKPRQMLQLISAQGAAEVGSGSEEPTQGAEEAAQGQEDAMRAALRGAQLGSTGSALEGAQEQRQALTRREELRILENLYACILTLEQLRRSADADSHTAQAALAERLWQELRVLEPLDVSDPHPFVALLSHVKGKRLLPRALRLLDAEKGLTTLTMLVASFGALDAVRNYAAWEQCLATESLRHVRSALTPQQAADVGRNIDAFMNSVLFNMIDLINATPLRIVSGMLALLLERNDIVSSAKSRPGVSVLTALLSRAETLRQASAAGAPDAPAAAEVEQWSSVFGVLLDRLAADAQLPLLFPSTRIKALLPFGVDVLPRVGVSARALDLDREDEPVWNLMALFAIHASLAQQQVLVQELRAKILSNVLAAMENAPSGPVPADDIRIRNVNLLLHALNLDAAQITL
ncbi:DNA topoisomerase 2-associated protein pat1 [Malassezia sp. CBS 17886]|nr:DNA topoisomerase 2-associated protein pat1 [Malassezia sp. CBS 17886]